LEWPNIYVCNFNRKFTTMIEKQNLTDFPFGVAFGASMDDDSLLFFDKYQMENQTLVTPGDLEELKKMMMSVSTSSIGNSTLVEVRRLFRFAFSAIS
jgi:hypothetical protein